MSLVEKVVLRKLQGQSNSLGTKVCVLVSGGVDSCVLLGLMAQQFRETFPAYICCGLRWEGAEIYWLRKYLKRIERRPRGEKPSKTGALPRGIIHPLATLSMPVRDLYQSHWSLPNTYPGSKADQEVPGWNSSDDRVYLPGRNLLLLAKASVYCAQHGISTIAMGQLKGNPFPDATPRFFRSAEKTISSALNFQIRIWTPFLRSSKGEVIQIGKQLGLPLGLSFSCLSPSPRHRPCGRCNKCAEREKAMRD